MSVYSEDSGKLTGDVSSEASEASMAGEKHRDYAPLPGGYRSIKLNSSFETVKEALKKEHAFDFRGEPDVSMQKKLGNRLISCRGRSFINYGFFQFKEEQLYLITLQLNPQKLDFYTIQKSLNSKYGPPARLSPQGMSWENEKMRLSLEYPLTVKYLDLALFDAILEEGIQHKSFQEINRKRFLEDF